MRAISVLAACLLMLAEAQALAQDCTVSAVGVNFGLYDPLATTPTDGQGQVQVQCTAGRPFTALLGPGVSSGALFQPRRMLAAGSGAPLAYNLFVDASRTLVWGDGTGTTQVQAGIGTGQPQVLIIYGRAPAGQDVPVGSYSDIVVVTVLL